MSTNAEVSRILQEPGGEDLNIPCSGTGGGNGGCPTPPRSLGVSPWVYLADEHKEEPREERKEGEQKEQEEGEGKEEEKEGEGCVSRLIQEARLDVDRALGCNAAPDDVVAMVHHQASIIDRLMKLVKGVNAEKKDLLFENKVLQLANDAMARKLASLVPDKPSMSDTTAVTTRPQQAPARGDVEDRPSTSVASWQALLRSIRLIGEPKTKVEVSSPPIAKDNSPAPSVFASSPAAEHEEVSPAAKASAVCLGGEGGAGREEGATPITGSVTPPASTPALAGENSAAGVAAFTEDAPERAPRAKAPATRGSVGGKKRASSRSSNSRVRQPTVASSGGVGSSSRQVSRTSTRSQAAFGSTRGVRQPTRPVNRTSARSHATSATSGGIASSRPVSRTSTRRHATSASSATRGVRPSTRPANEPSAPQSKGTRRATTSRQPLNCTRGTVTSRLRSRVAIKTSGPRGMVF